MVLLYGPTGWGFCHAGSGSGPLRAVNLSRHKWPGGLVNCCPLRQPLGVAFGLGFTLVDSHNLTNANRVCVRACVRVCESVCLTERECESVCLTEREREREASIAIT